MDILTVRYAHEKTRGLAMVGVMADIAAEMERSTTKHGDQSHLSDGTDQGADWIIAVKAKARTDDAARRGVVTWRDILEEEVAEAFAESDPALLRAELVQVAAVAAKWVEAIDGRG